MRVCGGQPATIANDQPLRGELPDHHRQGTSLCESHRLDNLPPWPHVSPHPINSSWPVVTDHANRGVLRARDHGQELEENSLTSTHHR